MKIEKFIVAEKLLQNKKSENKAQQKRNAKKTFGSQVCPLNDYYISS